MKRRYLIIVIIAIVIIIGIVIGTLMINENRKLHDKESLRTNFIGEWKVDNVTLTVTDNLASFKISDKSSITYEDCTYDLNSKDKFELKCAKENYTCELNSKYNKLTCKNDNISYQFIK